MKKRTNITQLPDEAELRKIVAQESKRIPIPAKKNVHYPDFTLFYEWLDFLGVSYDFMTNKKLLPSKILVEAEKIKDEVIAQTLKRNTETQLRATLKKIQKYLGEEDALKKSSAILVLGNHNIKRAEHAAKLFKKKLAPLLIITGRNPNYEKTRFPEGVAFARRAIDLGVPKDKILIEANSISIADNLKTTLNLLDHLNFDYSKGIISVNEWNQQRRAWCSLMKLTRAGTKIYHSNAQSLDPFLNPNSWFRFDGGIKVVFNEFIKLQISIKLGNIA